MFLKACFSPPRSELSKTDTNQESTRSFLPNIHGPELRSHRIEEGSSLSVLLSDGTNTTITKQSGRLYISLEATFSNDSFERMMVHAQRRAEEKVDLIHQQKYKNEVVSEEMDRVIGKIKELKGISFHIIPETGYVRFKLPYSPSVIASLQETVFLHHLMIAPISSASLPIDYSGENDRSGRIAANDESLLEMNLTSVNEQELSTAMHDSKERSDFNLNDETDVEMRIEKETDQTEQNKLDSSDLNRFGDSWSAIHLKEFIQLAQSEIGQEAQINGSSVRVGIVDSGLNFNHPAFDNKSGSNQRVLYMKDYTGRGRVYFNPQAMFEASSTPLDHNNQEFIIHAEFIPSLRTPRLPDADQFETISQLKIKVSPELGSLLLAPNHSGAMLGVLDESLLQNEEEHQWLDMNESGSRRTKRYLIFIPGRSSHLDRVYMDSEKEGDFRYSKPIGDWNLTRAFVPLRMDKFGFQFQTETLLGRETDEAVQVRSVSLIGFDPSGHGTHVAGIIGADPISATLGDNTGSAFSSIPVGVAPSVSLLFAGVEPSQMRDEITSEAIQRLVIEGRPDVVNISLGKLSNFNDHYGIFQTILNRLTQTHSVLFIVSAGNDGPSRQTVSDFAATSHVLSVGASARPSDIMRQYHRSVGSERNDSTIDHQSDFVFDFSARGPTSAGGFAPHLTAPGTLLSSVPLHSMSNLSSGVRVMRGTSMAAPVVTGAYSLLLDAIRKYNRIHSSTPLSVDPLTLRSILIESARPYNSYQWDLETNQVSRGIYTWADQGKGMIDLVAAWKKVLECQTSNLPTALQDGNQPIHLDYDISVRMQTPSGVSYLGNLVRNVNDLMLGKGVYIDYAKARNLYPVSVSRSLPQSSYSSPQFKNLQQMLRTTQDEFYLKTTLYGSEVPWLKVGSLDQSDCNESSINSSHFILRGEGARLQRPNDSSWSVDSSNLNNINICIDRKKILSELAPGEHGALISAYRIVKGERSPVSSFIIPVFLTVPHQTIGRSTHYEMSGEVGSYQVKKNYVQIPSGTSLIQVSLEVPEIKHSLDQLNGVNDHCSGVYLKPAAGSHQNNPFTSLKKSALAFNCMSDGELSSPSARRVSFTIANPVPGIWDLPIIGYERFPKSHYKLRIDYINAKTNLEKVILHTSQPQEFTGKFDLILNENTFASQPDLSQSRFTISALKHEGKEVIQQGQMVYVQSPQFEDALRGDLSKGLSADPLTVNHTQLLRYYPVDSGQIEIGTLHSPGNDIDLRVLECNDFIGLKLDVNLDTIQQNCVSIAISDGPGDLEKVSFRPVHGKCYIMSVFGARVKEQSTFDYYEKLSLETELLSLSGRSLSSGYLFDYDASAYFQKKMKVLNHPLFISGRYSAMGSIEIIAEDHSKLSVIPVDIVNDSLPQIDLRAS